MDLFSQQMFSQSCGDVFPFVLTIGKTSADVLENFCWQIGKHPRTNLRVCACVPFSGLGLLNLFLYFLYSLAGEISVYLQAIIVLAGVGSLSSHIHIIIGKYVFYCRKSSI